MRGHGFSPWAAERGERTDDDDDGLILVAVVSDGATGGCVPAMVDSAAAAGNWFRRPWRGWPSWMIVEWSP